ncbi:MAG: hypothetical protein JW891_04715 [Candidatus Lokiarchaeota archaeon]|nr:hypothetical protein [Candidatus Lokiarchaeota archaeon]
MSAPCRSPQGFHVRNAALAGGKPPEVGVRGIGLSVWLSPRSAVAQAAK